MNYAVNHNVVMGQKIPINEKKITFFGTGLVSLICFSQNMRILQNFNLTQKSECRKQQVLSSITHYLNVDKVIPIH